jgi:hypothetical protein
MVPLMGQGANNGAGFDLLGKTTASVGMGMGVLFVVFVALKQLVADDDPD